MSEKTEKDTKGRKMFSAIPEVLESRFIEAMAAAIEEKQEEKGDWRYWIEASAKQSPGNKKMCDYVSSVLADGLAAHFEAAVKCALQGDSESASKHIVHLANYAMMSWAFLKDEKERQDEKAT